jgi:hypothetical protein
MIVFKRFSDRNEISMPFAAPPGLRRLLISVDASSSVKDAMFTKESRPASINAFAASSLKPSPSNCVL